jgi:hypothetical protein
MTATLAPDRGAQPGSARACDRCSCRLAADNVGRLCSPCARAQRAGLANGALRLDPAAVAAAFERGGVPAVVDALGCRAEEAIAAAIGAGVLPALYLRRIDVLAELVHHRELSHVAAAERTGLSRWTVATYRRDLGMDRAG